MPLLKLSTKRITRIGAAAVLTACISLCQTDPNQTTDDEESKRILGVVPNYGTVSGNQPYAPLTSRQKFKLASKDTFDPGAVALVAIFAGESQFVNANRAFGEGAPAFARYFGAAYGDLLIGNYMAEAIFPSMLHQDPRYFARRTGTAWSRLGSAMSQIFWTHTDSGHMQFNYSEIVGNSVTVAISNAYYVDHRSAGDAASRLGLQLGVDMGTNILKEFWPDIRRKLPAKHPRETK
jgi:hypothetical protein